MARWVRDFVEHLGLRTYYLTAHDVDPWVAFLNQGILSLKTNWQNGRFQRT